MSIKAKKSTIIRIFGAILIFNGLILSVIFNFLVIKSFLGYSLWLILIIPWIIFIIALKLSNDLICNNFKLILYLLIIHSIILSIIAVIWNLLIAMIVLLNFILNLLLLASWSVSLSIYKKKKILFLVSGFSYITGTLIFNLHVAFLGNLISIITVAGGIAIIVIIEYNMCKKGYLNYI